MDWPPYSPDLNLIEHLWAQLKQWIHDQYPELNEMGASDEAYQRLFQAIQRAEAWRQFSLQLRNTLTKLQPHTAQQPLIRINSKNGQGVALSSTRTRRRTLFESPVSKASQNLSNYSRYSASFKAPR